MCTTMRMVGMMMRCANSRMSRGMLPNSPERVVSHWTLDRPADLESFRDIFRAIVAYYEQLDVFGIRSAHEVNRFGLPGRCDRNTLRILNRIVELSGTLLTQLAAVAGTHHANHIGPANAEQKRRPENDCRVLHFTLNVHKQKKVLATFH